MHAKQPLSSGCQPNSQSEHQECLLSHLFQLILCRTKKVRRCSSCEKALCEIPPSCLYNPTLLQLVFHNLYMGLCYIANQVYVGYILLPLKGRLLNSLNYGGGDSWRTTILSHEIHCNRFVIACTVGNRLTHAIFTLSLIYTHTTPSIRRHTSPHTGSLQHAFCSLTYGRATPLICKHTLDSGTGFPFKLLERVSVHHIHWLEWH